jgi:hypothetical protein
MMEGVNLRYIVTTYINIIMDPPIQLLYANKIIKKINEEFLDHEFTWFNLTDICLMFLEPVVIISTT